MILKNILIPILGKFYSIMCGITFVRESMIFLQRGMYIIFYLNNYHFLSHTFHSFHPCALNSWVHLPIFPSMSLIYYFKTWIIILDATDWLFNSVTMFYLSWNNLLFPIRSFYCKPPSFNFIIFSPMVFYFYFIETFFVFFTYTSF